MIATGDKTEMVKSFKKKIESIYGIKIDDDEFVYTEKPRPVFSFWTQPSVDGAIAFCTKEPQSIENVGARESGNLLQLLSINWEQRIFWCSIEKEGLDELITLLDKRVAKRIN